MNTLLKKYNLGAYLTITADEHLNEYLGQSDKRVEYLTGFTGSNGLAVTCKKNVLFTDSRYFIQAKNELTNYELRKMGIDKLEDFLNEKLDIKRVGLNPRHYSHKQFKDMESKFQPFDIELVPVIEDFVDAQAFKPPRTFNSIYSIEDYKIWDFYKKNFALLNNSVEFSKEDIKKLMLFDLPEDTSICGKSYKEKIEEVRQIISENEEIIFTEMDTICWLFNLRGSDIEFNPLFYGYATVTKTHARIFCKSEVLLEDVEILPYEDFEDYVINNTNKLVVSGACNAYLDSVMTDHKFTNKVRELQSKKSQAELEGFNLAYILDGVALNSLFTYMRKSKDLTEKDVAHKLLEIKSKFIGFKFPSFESIVGAGPNSAIIHYSAGDVPVKDDEVCLLDVGSNYIFGTTDTSRTLFNNKDIPDKVKYNYTRILKGQLRAMRQIYPKNINGCIIDSLTRLDLWDCKENYGHASGHGVGHFLCVHENPPCLSYNYNVNILLDQVFSVEPGIYLEGEFGVRLENLVFSQQVDDKFMRLVNITYVPYQLDMIDINLISDSELEYLNETSVLIRKKLLPFVTDEDERDFLLENTKELLKPLK